VLNPWQKAVAETYAEGDFAHVASIEDAREVGDTLFLFLMIELGTREDCDSWAVALRRVEIALGQLEDVREALCRKAPSG
jgi:hypothetical protein